MPYHSNPKINGMINLRTHVSMCQNSPLNNAPNQAKLAIQFGVKR